MTDVESAPPAEIKNGGDVVKTDVSSLENISELEQSIIQQIEYYFGDANLNRDKFLKEQISKDDGWVPISTLLTFKRLAALSEDAEVIVNALKKSDEGLIEIYEDGTKIRRHPERPLPECNEEYRKDILSRTVYLKGFPRDAQMAEIIDFLKPYQKVENIFMRKYHDKVKKEYIFKGSILVTFATKEQGEEVLKKEKIEYKGNELIKKWETDHLKEKAEEKSKFDSKRNKNKQDEKKPSINLPKGSVIFLDGFNEEINREDIKEAIVSLGGEVAFIDYERGKKSAYVRLTEENSAKPIFDKFTDGKLKINDLEFEGRVLEGDEENEFLEKAVKMMKDRRNNSNNNRFNKGGRKGFGGGGDRHNRKRRGNRDDDDDEPPAKQ